MFNIGDQITHPMHGAGVIVGIEEKEVLDQTKQYYMVNIVSDGMEILIPVDKAEESGVRPVATVQEVDAMLEALKGERGEKIANWSKRYQDNLEKLKTGDPVICAHVVRDLTLMDRTKGLSSGEKRMLFGAKNFMISEMMMVYGMEKAAADQKIESLIGQPVGEA